MVVFGLAHGLIFMPSLIYLIAATREGSAIAREGSWSWKGGGEGEGGGVKEKGGAAAWDGKGGAGAETEGEGRMVEMGQVMGQVGGDETNL